MLNIILIANSLGLLTAHRRASIFPHFSMASRIGRLTAKNTALLVCDVQERFRPLIQAWDTVEYAAITLSKAARLLNLPAVICTEQYPKALGHTIPTVTAAFPENANTYEKALFSMLIPEVLDQLKAAEIKSVILCGIEAHVCVQQTALDCLDMGMDVHVVADGVSSQRVEDRIFALKRMRAAGAQITTVESVIFELMKTKDAPCFKEMTSILKVPHPPTGLPLSAL